ncbi:hypothetical protein KR067_005391 [Drosophila pandora]|nr:hypothetical protein KR067_005391 [Drosophila pandora]
MRKTLYDAYPEDCDLLAEVFEVFEVNNLNNLDELDYLGDDDSTTSEDSDDSLEGIFIDLRADDEVKVPEPEDAVYGTPPEEREDLMARALALPGPPAVPVAHLQPEGGAFGADPNKVYEMMEPMVVDANTEGAETEAAEAGPVLILEVEDMTSRVTRRIPVTINRLMVESMAIPELLQVSASNEVDDPQSEDEAAAAEPEVAAAHHKEDPKEAVPVAEPGVPAKMTEPEQAASPMTAPVAEIDPEPKEDEATPMATPVAEPVAVPEEAHAENTSTSDDGEPNATQFQRNSDEIEVDDMGDMLRALVLTVAHFENL